MMSVTMAPTIISASEKINVLPSLARLQVDCRVPPGHGEETALRRIREVLGDDDAAYEIEFHEKVVGNGSRLDSPLMDAIEAWVARIDPGARVVPTMLPAFTDSRTFRDAFPDAVAYGFFPQRQKTLYEAWPLMHGKDERIDVRDVGFAASCYRDVTKELLG
jgi:acetylornithine deacetylase/succinyl-diaminopimelate desuccinylase-like protein